MSALRRKESHGWLLSQFIPITIQPASRNAIESQDPMKIDAPDELLQSDKWIFSDNVRKSGKMESPGARGQSLCNICQSLGENLVKFHLETDFLLKIETNVL